MARVHEKSVLVDGHWLTVEYETSRYAPEITVVSVWSEEYGDVVLSDEDEYDVCVWLLECIADG